MPPIFLSKPQQFDELVLQKYEDFVFDLDGVIWTGPGGNTLTPHVKETLEYLRSIGKRLAFVTNNATRSRKQYLEKFHSLGLTHVVLDEIFTCGSASASHLREVILPEIEKEGGPTGIYLIGQASMEEELREEGLAWRGGTDPEDDVLLPPQDFSSIMPDPEIGVVLFTFQMRINYKQLAKAFNYLNFNPDCRLVLTNDDFSMSIPGGGSIPGEGAIASVLLNARKNLQPLIVGKPHQPLLDVVHRALKFDPTKTIFVGDRLETDVLFGKRGGLDTLLVWTGNSKPHDLVGLGDHEEPTFIADSVGELLKGVPKEKAAPRVKVPGEVREEVRQARGEVEVRA
ncbi:HAD-like domain-containing protein [Leucosporidium creatinivorum]|uniref:HAD-like domain-containing protein n=1 Tax=Leucosporidium creatinivorum TaxID=106004 RepID=A0A1Y2G4W5_9BASI|nr:HAD-like domain-containing protein [Leucosporidium creatinivorum]